MNDCFNFSKETTFISGRCTRFFEYSMDFLFVVDMSKEHTWRCRQSIFPVISIPRRSFFHSFRCSLFLAFFFLCRVKKMTRTIIASWHFKVAHVKCSARHFFAFIWFFLVAFYSTMGAMRVISRCTILIK